MNKNNTGFTLIEMIVVITITVLMVTVVYETFRVAMMAYTKQKEQQDVNRTMRHAWTQLSRDLRCAFMSTTNTSITFVGTHKQEYEHDYDAVQFVTYMPTSYSSSGGLCIVQYYIDVDPLTHEQGLVKALYGFPFGKNKNDKNANATPLRIQEIAPRVTSLKLHYYNGKKWVDAWGNDNNNPATSMHALPGAVAISIEMSDNEHEKPVKTFSTIVPIFSSEIAYVRTP